MLTKYEIEEKEDEIIAKPSIDGVNLIGRPILNVNSTGISINPSIASWSYDNAITQNYATLYEPYVPTSEQVRAIMDSIPF